MHRPGGISKAEDGLADGVDARVGEPAEAENLARVHVEADVLYLARNGEIPHLEDRLPVAVGDIVVAVVVAGDVAPDHHHAQLVGVCVLRLDAADDLAVAQYCDDVGYLDHFLDVVRYDDDAAAHLAEFVYQVVEPVAVIERQRLRDLVEQEYLRVYREGARELYHLALFYAHALGQAAELRHRELPLFKNCGGRAVHLAEVDDAALCKLPRPPEEDVDARGQAAYDAELLHDHGDAARVGVERGVGIVLFPVNGHLARVGAVEPRYLRKQRALAGAVFSEQTVDLAAAEGEIYVPVGVGRAEMLVEAANFKNGLAHFTTPFTFLEPIMPKMTMKAPRKASCRVPEGTPSIVSRLNIE